MTPFIVEKRQSVVLSEYQQKTIKRLFNEGVKAYEIASITGHRVMDVKATLAHMGLRYSPKPAREEKQPDKYDFKIDVNTLPIEFAKAEPALKRHFTHNGGYDYYKGVKLDMPLKWTQAMRDLNKILKSKGRKQFTNVPEWVV